MAERVELLSMVVVNDVDNNSLSDLMERFQSVMAEHRDNFDDVVVEFDSERRDVWSEEHQVLRLVGVR